VSREGDERQLTRATAFHLLRAHTTRCVSSNHLFPEPLPSGFNPDRGFSFVFTLWPAASAASTFFPKPLPPGLNQDRGFSFVITFVACCVSSIHLFSEPLPPELNQDRGFSFFRAKERKSPQKKERKPGLRVRRKKKLRTQDAKDSLRPRNSCPVFGGFISPNPAKPKLQIANRSALPHFSPVFLSSI